MCKNQDKERTFSSVVCVHVLAKYAIEVITLLITIQWPLFLLSSTSGLISEYRNWLLSTPCKLFYSFVPPGLVNIGHVNLFTGVIFVVILQSFAKTWPGLDLTKVRGFN